MITKKAAAEIEGLTQDRQRIKVLKQELEAINAKMYSPRGATLDAVPTRGGGNKQEEKLVKMIDDPRRKALQKEVKALEEKVASILETIEKLPDIERKVIKGYYFGDAGTNAKLMTETNYSEPHLIRIRLEALRRYAYMRGIDLQKS